MTLVSVLCHLDPLKHFTLRMIDFSLSEKSAMRNEIRCNSDMD